METGIHELTAAYALDALDPDERAKYEAHLQGCERCQEELSSFWETSEALAVAASGPAPSPALRDRILADVRNEPPQNVVPLAPRRARLAPALVAVTAVAALVAIVVGARSIQLSSDLDATREALRRERTAAAVLADPDATVVALQAGKGRLVVDPDGTAVLVLDGLGSAPAGKTYQAWIVEGETPAPAGLFPGEGGLDLVLVEGTVDEGDVVAVTVESSGGAETPTPPLVVASSPV